MYRLQMGPQLRHRHLQVAGEDEAAQHSRLLRQVAALVAGCASHVSQNAAAVATRPRLPRLVRTAHVPENVTLRIDQVRAPCHLARPPLSVCRRSSLGAANVLRVCAHARGPSTRCALAVCISRLREQAAGNTRSQPASKHGSCACAGTTFSRRGALSYTCRRGALAPDAPSASPAVSPSIATSNPV